MLTVGKSSSFINSAYIDEGPVLGAAKTRSNKSGPCHSGTYRQHSWESHVNKYMQKVIEIAKVARRTMMKKSAQLTWTTTIDGCQWLNPSYILGAVLGPLPALSPRIFTAIPCGQSSCVLQESGASCLRQALHESSQTEGKQGREVGD